AAEPSAFERCRTLCGMVTFGCNIPLFTFAYDQVLPIRFPGPDVSPALLPRARWLNYYDRDDVLAWPLRPPSPEYERVVAHAIEISVGGLLTGWTPMSHNRYWTDGHFTRPVAAFLESLL